VAYLIVGGAWRRTPSWRTYGWYTIATAWAAVVLILLLFVVLNPASSLAALAIGGLLERLIFVELFAWNVAVGWRILKTPSPSLEQTVP
jgi:hypothetical protein